MSLHRTSFVGLVMVGASAFGFLAVRIFAGHTAQSPASCDPQLTLPPGFCALVFADEVGAARHIAVAPNGDVFVALWSTPTAQGGVLALRDTNGDGRSDIRQLTTSDGGSGLWLTRDWLYHSTWTSVLRYRLRTGTFGIADRPDTIVHGLPRSGHAARSIVLSADAASLYMTIGAPTNACQEEDRAVRSRGRDPCPERERFAGIWRFDAARPGQVQDDGERIVSGLRHAVAFTRHPRTSALWAVQHGRDELGVNWPRGFTQRDGETKPAEELVRLARGQDYGWPYCYYDDSLQRRVLAPEYDGDGRRDDRCRGHVLPLLALPAHWAPNGLLFHSGRGLPSAYANGAFVAFHGGWYRPPPDNGFNVVFVPFQGDVPSGRFEVFADGFAGPRKRPPYARHRPVGLAEGPDGALYLTDDKGGRVWRIAFTRR